MVTVMVLNTAILMTTPIRSKIDTAFHVAPGTARRGAVAALTAAILLSVAIYAYVAATAVMEVRAMRAGALLGDLRSKQAARLDMLSDPTVRRAIAAEPMDGAIVNVAMARDVRQHGNGRTENWLAILARLGWRDTPSLQNRLYAVASAGNMDRVLDISDALMRRQKLLDQVILVLSMAEADPVLHGPLIDRLAENPPWRAAYLSAVAHLKERSQLIARFDLLRQLRRRHVRLDKDEVIPSILALDRADLPQYGFALWQRIQPGVARPLDDPDFARAGRSDQDGHNPVPYEWQTMSGEGFSAAAVRDGAQTTLSIDWNGRGVPLFAQQRTSATPGFYALDVQAPAEEKADLSALVFRLVCDSTTSTFAPVAGDITHLRTITPVACSYPVLQIAGDIQPSPMAHLVTINRLFLYPVGAATKAH